MSTKESWEQYAERLGHYFTANGVTDANRQRLILLAEVGPTTYALISSLVSPDKAGDKSFDDIVKLLKTHFNPEPSEIVERYKFHTRTRQEKETVSEFVAELRTIARYCKFGDALQDSLRDRLVCGINEDAIQRRLLSEKKLTFDKALEIAISMEVAKQNVSELQSTIQPQQVDVHKMTTQPPSAIASCYRCKGTHQPEKCKFRTAGCHTCGKLGHIQRACRSGPQQPRRHPSKKGGGQKPFQVKQLSQYKVNQVRGDNPIELEVVVDGKQLRMELDTGAAGSIMPYPDFTRLWPNRKMQDSQVSLQTYSGQLIQAKGEVEVVVAHNGKKATLPLIIVQSEGPILLGRNWLKEIPVDWKSIYQVKLKDELQTVLTKHSSVFEEGLGRLEGFKAKIYVDAEATPKFLKARSVPYAKDRQGN